MGDGEEEKQQKKLRDEVSIDSKYHKGGAYAVFAEGR
jgi:hypothetical protein